MKSKLLLLMLCSAIFVGCQKENEIVPAPIERACYRYYIATNNVSIPNQNGYPFENNKLENTFCNLTQDEAEDKKSEYLNVEVITQGNYTIIRTTNCTMVKL